MRISPAFLLVIAAGVAAADPPPSADPMSDRIAQLEAEIRSLVAAQASDAGVAGAAAAPDYTAAKARASADVRRRLELVEYVLADNDYTRAIDGCNAILRDHPDEPATKSLKYRILSAMVSRERDLLERERAYRAEESKVDTQRDSVVPREPARLARKIWVFDEDLQEADRQAVRQRLQEKLTLNYDGVKVGEVLKPLFAVAGINYVILDSALSDETLTIHLVDDTVENALLTISKLVKVRYNYSANTVFIGAEDSEVMVSEIIRLKSGLTDVVTEIPLPQAIASGGDSSGGNNAPAPAPAAPAAAGGENKSDLERFLEKVPDLVAGWPAQGKWFLDRKSNTVYVRATPAAVAELRRMLAALDYHSAQVLIEARFIEVNEEAMRSLGIDWGGGMIGNKASVFGGSNNFATQPTGISGATGAAAPATMGGGGLLAQVLLTPTGTLGIFSRISALESEKKAERLTEPRILTLNNAVGNIQLVQSVSYIEKYDYSNSTSSTVTNANGTTNVSSSNPIPVWKTVNTGITLRVRPSIARNSDVITLDIRPSVTVEVPGSAQANSRVLSAASNNSSSQDLTVTKPDFITRTLATVLHIQNGQTVVLGGQSLDYVENTDSGVPGLRSIPVLGRLFSSEGKVIQRANLLIFVTAHIIDPSGAKIGEEIQRLRDTATVLLPAELRAAESAQRAEEAKRNEAAAEQETKPPEKSKTGPPPVRNGSR